jgi:hypothetical protein
LQDGELMMWVDFVSWYRASPRPADGGDMHGTAGNGKVNDLVVVLEWKEAGVLKRLYVDMPCERNSTPHDHYFYAQCLLDLFSKERGIIINEKGVPKFSKIFRISDNGPPLMSRYACFVEHLLQVETGILIEVVPLCPRHAYSLADSHGGHVKPALRRKEIMGEYPRSDAELKEFLENSLSNTICLPQAFIDTARVDRLTYGRVGGIGNIRVMAGISTVGHLVYITPESCPGVGVKEKIGFAKARTLVGKPEPWGVSRRVPPGFERYVPSWRFFDMQGWRHTMRCVKCSQLYTKQVFRGRRHVCAFTTKGCTAALNLLIDAENELKRDLDEPGRVLDAPDRVISDDPDNSDNEPLTLKRKRVGLAAAAAAAAAGDDGDGDDDEGDGDEGDFYPLFIHDERKLARSVEYLIEWEGFPDENKWSWLWATQLHSDVGKEYYKELVKNWRKVKRNKNK